MSRTLTARIGIEINYFRVMKCQGKDVGTEGGRRHCLTKLFDGGYFVRGALHQNVADREILLIAAVAMYVIDYPNKRYISGAYIYTSRNVLALAADLYLRTA